MQTKDTDKLARELIVARRRLNGDMPSSPAWTATSEWVDDLERRIRAIGLDPDVVTRDATWLTPRRPQRAVA